MKTPTCKTKLSKCPAINGSYKCGLRRPAWCSGQEPLLIGRQNENEVAVMFVSVNLTKLETPKLGYIISSGHKSGPVFRRKL